MSPEIDRRRYRRARAAILVRPLGPLARVAPREVGDISVGGLRAYSDDRQRVGARLEIELVFPDGGSASCMAEVVWVEKLPVDAPALYEMGLRFVEVDPDDVERISGVLED
jgi:hypothetical protein